MIAEPLTNATNAELDALSALCLRSKAHWGYDADFMSACTEVLSVTSRDLAHPNAVVRDGTTFAGYARLDLTDHNPELSKLFVCPKHMGTGVGTALINWAKTTARRQDVSFLHVESDPEAASFYEHHGAERIGEVPSEVIPNRSLPLLKLPTANT